MNLISILKTLAIIVLIQAAYAVSTGNGGSSLTFNGMNRAARFRTPVISFKLEGSLTYEAYMHEPSDTPSGLLLGAVGDQFGFFDETGKQVLGIYFYVDATIVFQDKMYYEALPTKNSQWVHHSFVWTHDISTGETTMTIGMNVGRSDEVTYVIKTTDLSEAMTGSYDIGKGSNSEALSLGTHGRFDNFCHWNRALSNAELAIIQEKGCNGIDTTDLEFHYDFEDVRTDSPQVKDLVSGDYNGLIRSETFGDAIFPIVTPTSFPISGSGYQTHQIFPDSETTVSIVTNSATSWKLLPTDLTILGLGSLKVDGVDVTAGVEQTTFDLVFTPSSTLTVDSIEFFITAIDGGDEVNGKVTLVPNKKPTCVDFDWSIDESDIKMLYVDKAYRLAEDDGDQLEFYITSLPVIDGLEVRVAPSTVTDIFDSCSPITLIPDTPYHLPFSRLATKHVGILTSSLVSSFKYKMYDGMLFSDECTVNFTVNVIAKPPVPRDSSITVNEDNTITVETKFDEYDGEPVVVTITKFPSKGTLFQHDSEVEVKGHFSSVLTTQWAKTATASSAWPGEGYAASGMEGEADRFPEHGDLLGTWGPSIDPLEDGREWWEHQWIEITLEKPVMVTAISLYETWHPNSCTQIKAKNPDTGEWEIIWSVEETKYLILNPDPAVTQSDISSYTTCPKPFVTSEIHFDLVLSPNHYVMIDAIQVNGLEEVPMNVVIDPLNRLLFKPDSQANGLDSFEYVCNDCQYYQSRRDLKPAARTGTVNLDITPVNDDPVAIHQTLSAQDEDSQLLIELNASDPDETSVEQLEFQIKTLPKHGILKFGNLFAETNMAIPRFLTYIPTVCKSGGKTNEDSFEFVVLDGDNAKDYGVIEVNVECLDKTYEQSISVLALFWIVNAILVGQSIALIISFVKHKRNIVVRLASLRFSVTGLVFAASGTFYGALFTSQKAWACNLRGFALLMVMGGYAGMLFFKSLRIAKLVNNKKFKKIRVTDKALFVKFFMPMFACVLVIGAAISLFGTECHEGYDSSAEEGYLITDCKYKSWALGVIVAVWIAGFTALGYISFKVRHAPMELNDANHITVTVFILIMFFLFKFPMAFINIDSPTVNLIVDGIGFAVVLIICNLVLFTPKVIQIRHMDTRYSSSRSHESSSQATATTMQGGSFRADEMAQYREAMKPTSIMSGPSNQVYPSSTISVAKTDNKSSMKYVAASNDGRIRSNSTVSNITNGNGTTTTATSVTRVFHKGPNSVGDLV